jgi:inosine-uridine nucleoside N-ribohydrolase
MFRTMWKQSAWLIGVLPFALPAYEPPCGASEPAKRVPVILDTDIGADIDDTWALAFLLRCPELDVKLVVGDYGNAMYRARLICKILQRAGRSDVPVGIGLRLQEDPARWNQRDWLGDYDLASYPGKVHEDGVQAIIDTIMEAPEPITVIAIGPLPNIAAALERQPKIASKARFVGMHGSVRRGYGGKSSIDAEWNVRADPKSCQKVLTAPWEITITPLDTCGLVILEGDHYKRVRASDDPLARAVMENYRAWSRRVEWTKATEYIDRRSSVLFDTVAVYLAFSQELCRMEKLGIRVDDQGFTRIDPAAKTMQVATEWRDIDAFYKLLTQRLTKQAEPAER